MACKREISHGSGSPQSELSEDEFFFRGLKSVPPSGVKQDWQELLGPQMQQRIKEEESEIKVTPLLIPIKQETDDKVPVCNPIKHEPNDPSSESRTDREVEKAKLKEECGEVSRPKPQTVSHPFPAAGSRPECREKDETEPESQKNQGPADWLAPVEDDGALDECRRRRRLGFESVCRSLLAVRASDSESDDKEGEEDPSLAPADHQTHRRDPDGNIRSLRCSTGAENHQVELEAASPHHRNTKNFACQECGKTFVSRRDRDRHNRTHSGEKPFSCPHCCKSFSDWGNRCKHMLIHSGAKPHLCPECGRGFSERGNLRKHMDYIHSSIPKSQCKDCGKSFTGKRGLDRHIKSAVCSTMGPVIGNVGKK
ncbi:gastrula zinc finger protein 5-1 [Esox lucius]|uniref:gastrula zinc finger protein 5-1 n=1 Tax=Esox lucius TaxID=8010 RepID=UPI001476E4BF|nr:gastrula zinc finger protein 5-1 [Esox lucius]